MECVDKIHFTDLAKGLAYYVLATLPEPESEDNTNYEPNYLTDVVIDRLKNLSYDGQMFEKWGSTDSLREPVLTIFQDNL